MCQALLLLAVVGGGGATTAVAAQDALGSTPVAIGGSGLLLPYYTGATWALRKAGVIKPGRTRLSGLSGGAYSAVFNALRISGPRNRDIWTGLFVDLYTRYEGRTSAGTAAVQEMLYTVIPPNVNISRLNGKVAIAMAQLDGSKTNLTDSASWIVNSFDDRADLFSALRGTYYVPGFDGILTYTIFRNQPVIDGAFANGFQQLCPNGNTNNCIKVSSFYVGDKANQTCDPVLCAAAYEASRCVNSPRTNIVTELYKNDMYVDRWALSKVQERFPPQLWYDKDPYPLPPFVPHNQTTPDIHPGKYLPLPIWKGKRLLACQWVAWAGNLPAASITELKEAIMLLYKQGYADAREYLRIEKNITIEASAD